MYAIRAIHITDGTSMMLAPALVSRFLFITGASVTLMTYPNHPAIDKFQNINLSTDRQDSKFQEG